MYDNALFGQLVAAGNSSGEIVGVERFLVKVKGLDGSPVGALVRFESGEQGLVREIHDDFVLVLNLDSESSTIGGVVVVEEFEFTTQVGDQMIGRVMSPVGHVLDGKEPLTLSGSQPVFAEAPGIHERGILKDQLYSGVMMVDMLFPIVFGQRIAIMGDTKTGKTSFLMQLGVNQAHTETLIVYVMIGKRQIDIDHLVTSLNESGAIANSIVIVANIFDSLAQSYIAPYVGCAIAEYFWRAGRDVVIVYDDLTAHAKIHREISLLAQTSPGRDSYPGDMFFAHSSLLERAGKLSVNDKTLTALPVILTPGDDITAYLPTSIMSITDGQIIFDQASFRQNIRPAVNTGLSVSRVGGRAQTPSQKALSVALMKYLAQYRQALEFAHFGSDMSEDSKRVLIVGKQLFEALRQTPAELLGILEQELILTTILRGGGSRLLNIAGLKQQAAVLAPSIQDETGIEAAAKQLLETASVEVAA